MKRRRSKMFKTEAVIHSLAKEDSNKPYDMATIIHEKDSNDVVAEYKGVRYTAIFNPFVCRYYVDDIYGKLQDPKRCPCCGDELT
jgi:hypothetical protein